MIYLIIVIVQAISSFVIYKLLYKKLNNVESVNKVVITDEKKSDDIYRTIIPNYEPIKYIPKFKVEDKHKRNLILSLCDNIDIWFVKFDNNSTYFINNKVSDKIYITVRKDLSESNFVVDSTYNLFNKEDNNYIQPLLHSLISSYEKVNSVEKLKKNTLLDNDFDKIVNSVDLRDDKFQQLGI